MTDVSALVISGIIVLVIIGVDWVLTLKKKVEWLREITIEMRDEITLLRDERFGLSMDMKYLRQDVEDQLKKTGEER